MRALLALMLAVPLAAGAKGPVVTLAFVGDINLAGLPEAMIQRGGDPFAPFAPILDAADARIGNLECVVATGGEPIPDKPYTFRAQPETLARLRQRFDAVSLANNHTGDFGPTALRELLGLLEGEGIGYFGAGANLARAHEPLILERRGLRIALLGYDEFLPRSFEADAYRAGVAWSEDEHVRHDIRTARERHRADLVITFIHWGWEHERRAAERQRHLARIMIEAGADAVIGGHPHVVQDTEIYLHRPVIYSLGNFVFDGFEDPEANTGWVLLLELDSEGARAWRATVARIDREGVPHPTNDPGTCWERDQAAAGPCSGP